MEILLHVDSDQGDASKVSVLIDWLREEHIPGLLVRPVMTPPTNGQMGGGVASAVKVTLETMDSLRKLASSLARLVGMSHRRLIIDAGLDGKTRFRIDVTGLTDPDAAVNRVLAVLEQAAQRKG